MLENRKWSLKDNHYTLQYILSLQTELKTEKQLYIGSTFRYILLFFDLGMLVYTHF